MTYASLQGTRFYGNLTHDWMTMLASDVFKTLHQVIDGNIIVELKAIAHIDTPHRRQLWNYMNLTHLPFGMLINFSPDGLYSEWYHRDPKTGIIDKVKLFQRDLYDLNRFVRFLAKRLLICKIQFMNSSFFGGNTLTLIVVKSMIH